MPPSSEHFSWNERAYRAIANAAADHAAKVTRAEVRIAAAELATVLDARIELLKKWNAGELLAFSGLTEAKATWDKFLEGNG